MKTSKDAAFPVIGAGVSGPLVAYSSLLGLFFVAIRRFISPLGFDNTYLINGESLVHRLWNPEISTRLPLASVMVALLHQHPFAEHLVSPAATILAFACALSLGAGWLAFPVALVQAMSPWGIFPQSVYTLLILIVVLLIIDRADSDSLVKSACLAGGIGVTIFFRSTLAFLPPLLVATEFQRRRAKSAANLWKHLLILGVVPYLLLIPWLRVNWNLHRQIIPFERHEADRNIIAGALGFVGVPDTSDCLSLVPDSPPHLDRSGEVIVWAVREVFRHPVRYAIAYVRRLGVVFMIYPILWMGAAWALFRARSTVQKDLRMFIAYFVMIYCTLAILELFFVPLRPLLLAIGAAALMDATPEGWRIRRPLPGALGSPNFSRVVALGALGFFVVLSAYVLVVLNEYNAMLKAPPSPILALDAAITDHPSDAWLYNERAKWNLERGNLKQALVDSEKASGLAPDARYRLVRAWIAMLLGRPAELFAFARFHGEYPLAVRPLLKSYGFYKFGRFDDARRAYAEADRLCREDVLPFGDSLARDSASIDQLTVERRRRMLFDVAFLSRLTQPERAAFLQTLGNPPDAAAWLNAGVSQRPLTGVGSLSR